jgi:hypothetical protein
MVKKAMIDEKIIMSISSGANIWHPPLFEKSGDYTPMQHP